MDFQNRKWNYPNRKWNYFSHFQASDEKTFFITYSPYLPRNSKWIFKTGNGIIQTGNEIISPISRPPIKKPLLKNIFHFHQGIQNWFSKQEMEFCKQEIELYILFPSLWSKNFFNKMMPSSGQAQAPAFAGLSWALYPIPPTQPPGKVYFWASSQLVHKY